MEDGPGEFWAHTADHPFADVWSREGLSMRDRRLLLTGTLSATGQIDIAESRPVRIAERGIGRR